MRKFKFLRNFISALFFEGRGLSLAAVLAGVGCAATLSYAAASSSSASTLKIAAENHDGQNALPLFIPNKPEKPLKFCTAQKEFLQLAENFSEWEEITGMRGVAIKMPYATFDNFSGHNLYCGMQRAFLHRNAAKMLRAAGGALKKQAPNYKFIIFDAARPNHAQAVLKAAVRGTPYTHFVSSPVPAKTAAPSAAACLPEDSACNSREGEKLEGAIKPKSLHAYGMALDIGLLDENGELVDMGLPYDSFAFYAGKKGERQALEMGLLTQEQVKNRELLRSVMGAAGWINLSSEWWHFNAALGDSVRTNYNYPH